MKERRMLPNNGLERTVNHRAAQPRRPEMMRLGCVNTVVGRPLNPDVSWSRPGNRLSAEQGGRWGRCSGPFSSPLCGTNAAAAAGWRNGR
jgi:hypothetical protein